MTLVSDFGFEYDTLGRRTSLTLPNGITSTYTYDNAGRLLDMKHLSPFGFVLEALSYSYDSNGNRTSMARENLPVKLLKPVVNTSYNQANQMLTFNDKNMTYDANGNMTSVRNSCGTTTYDWDVRNRLVGISGFNFDCSPLTASFKYDALGRRVQKNISSSTSQLSASYLYDGLDIVQEIENGTVTANYIRTLNIDEPLARIKSDGTLRYYQQDALGSVVALTDENGVVKTQYNYDPFGNVAVSGDASDNSFQFAGRENDGTGHLFERNRYYNFELMRYISEDPIGLAGGDVNFYVRVGNNPVNFVDPWGLDREIIFWSPLLHPGSIFGHVSSRGGNGENFSFGPDGWDKTYPTADQYIERQTTNNKRTGLGVVVELNANQDAQYDKCMSNAKATMSGDDYNGVVNCSSPSQACLIKVGIPMSLSILPASFQKELLDSGAVKSINWYKAKK